MARFVLQLCRLRSQTLVPRRDENPLDLDWDGLVARLAPAKTQQAMMTLRRLQVGAFVGLSRHPSTDQVGNFLLINPDRSGRLGWLLAQDRSFSNRLIEVFRVQEAEWDHKFEDVAV